MTITHNRLQFPEGPYRTMDYLDLPTRSEPPVERRWHALTIGSETINLFWRGSCNSCSRALWDTHGTTTLDEFPIRDYIATSSLPAVIDAKRWDDLKDEDTFVDGDNTFIEGAAVCINCLNDEHSLAQAMRTARAAVVTGARYRVIEWPTEIIAPMQERVRAREAANAHLVTPHPVIPKKGAFMWQPEEGHAQLGHLRKFVGWTEDRKVMLTTPEGASVDPVEPDKVEVLTAAVYGVHVENGILLPSSGMPVEPVTLRSWARGNATTERHRDKVQRQVSASVVAIRVPVLDPETESLEHRADRLQREKERLETIVHRRMVAEGVARQWCETFDPMLDATGLQPRKKKAVLTGTMTFSMERDKPLTERELTSLRDGSMGWSSFITASAIRLVDVTCEEPESLPSLS